MAKTNTIITIGRQFGSAGREIGYKVAEDLGIKLYDREMLDRAAKESGICQELFETHDEKPTNSFLYSLVMDTYSLGYSAGSYADMPINHKVFLAQFDAIKKIADEGPCILVGRCADYALEEYDNVLSVFIHADLDSRIRRIARIYDLTDAKAKELILKTDKKRSSYYNYYSNKKWGSAESYHMCLDSSVLGISGTAEAIEKLVELKENNTEKI
ncbi:AAA family ATPase [Faecalicatena contorta]|uniref:cytidylate kinase-like family protein n=1 Tax=Faecalicatena contorta TaxID=39482 RepID=UPI001F3A770D|nr:cytidylate kinase-like family protein [Faecalicatena contorta]MCF2554880.1 cytidylate kinase-like family protein [Faecalicatena contorta]MCF2680375.1 cytidylate kinase-like family protein [Faecalicatena contorta]